MEEQAPKDPAQKAVRELRQALGESQQAFAYRMKTAVRTIARWETVQRPSLVALGQLIQVAQGSGRKDLAQVFLQAVFREIPPPVNSISYRYQREDDGSHHGYVLMHVEGLEQAKIAGTFASAMHLVYSSDEKARDSALELLRDFQSRFREEQKAGKFGGSK